MILLGFVNCAFSLFSTSIPEALVVLRGFVNCAFLLFSTSILEALVVLRECVNYFFFVFFFILIFNRCLPRIIVMMIIN